MSGIARPQMKGLFHRELIKTIWHVSIGLAITGSVTWFTYLRPLRISYQRFYENYDAEAEAEKYVPVYRRKEE